MGKILVTGSSGLVGSACVEYFHERGHLVVGIDNGMRTVLFGPNGATSVVDTALSRLSNFSHRVFDIRNAMLLDRLFYDYSPDLVIHAAGQPSHDWSATDPVADFSLNAVGTLCLLDAVRRNAPDASFVFLSTNKVYGSLDHLPLTELPTRYDCDTPVNEEFSIDATMHSPFGVSKAAADLMVQEYGLYFGMNTVSLRCGCITGAAHAGVPLHGFLSYVSKCRRYTVYGDGKQVRDNLHAVDIARFAEMFAKRPCKGGVYNVGGGRANSISVLEALDAFGLSNPAFTIWRTGDHRWYITDHAKASRDYGWYPSVSLQSILQELRSPRILPEDR